MKAALAIALACTLMLVGCNSTTDSTDTTPAAVEPVVCGTVKKIHQVDGLYLAGQPSAEDYALLKNEHGIRTVIDLRKPTENRGFDEAKVVGDLGMRYVVLPWSGPDELTDDKLDAMRKLLRETDRPMLMKCGSSNRVGAGWLAYRVLDEGVAVEVALAEAKTVGLRTPAYQEKSLQYIASHQ